MEISVAFLSSMLWGMLWWVVNNNKGCVYLLQVGDSDSDNMQEDIGSDEVSKHP